MILTLSHDIRMIKHAVQFIVTHLVLGNVIPSCDWPLLGGSERRGRRWTWNGDSAGWSGTVADPGGDVRDASPPAYSNFLPVNNTAIM